jgi:hypothetical protein
MLEYDLEIRSALCKLFGCNLVLSPGYTSKAMCDSQAKRWRSLLHYSHTRKVTVASKQWQLR